MINYKKYIPDFYVGDVVEFTDQSIYRFPNQIKPIGTTGKIIGVNYHFGDGDMFRIKYKDEIIDNVWSKNIKINKRPIINKIKELFGWSPSKDSYGQI